MHSAPMRIAFSTIVAVCALVSAPAGAQTAAAPADSVLAGDHLTVGGAVIYGPGYEGSDDYRASAVPVLQGKLRGIEITPRPGGVALDMMKDAAISGFGVSLGPVIAWSGNRSGRIKDPVVRAAGKLDDAINLGVNGGLTAYRLLNRYDSVTLSADVTWDVAGAHGGMQVSPQVSYFTPLSPAAVVSLSLGATRVDADYARYYYDVSPAQAVGSGLPQFRARAGWKSVRAGMLVAYDLGGDLRDGGFALFAIGSYSRLLNDAGRTPYTALRGDADQWLGGVGLGYTF